MRIAYVCSDFDVPIYGHSGASVRVRETSKALRRLGHDVLIFTPRPGDDVPADFEVEVCEIGLEPPENRVHQLLRDDPSAGEAAAGEVRAMLYAAVLRYRLHGIFGVVRPDAIYERYSQLGSGGQTIARGMGIPLILDVSAPLIGKPGTDHGLEFGQTALALEHAVLQEADRLVAVSLPLAAWLEEIGVAEERIAVLPNSVDIDRFAAGAPARDAVRIELGIAPLEPVVGFAGALKPGRGAATLVRAVADMRWHGLTVRLLLVGDGPERSSLEALVRTEGIADTTIFAGPVSHERVPGMLAAIDVATVPCERPDGVYDSPLMLYEAMAAGRPVVGAAVGQIAASVRHGETGLLFPPGDFVALSEALTALVLDPDRAATLGRAAQDAARTGRTWDANAQAVIALVEQVRQPDLSQSLSPSLSI